ncbi:carbohydrate ABC transporter permease [Salipiger sp. 1_MG-2023]|uniref:carbohydrate ABC transporter permease n=1 Tax=Salipiger sp. 1_MG-2023 TaxID=3062665 RepID=UPI0026E2C33E|nr:carbohydrate ABC transporter permease [Salipiger sp. 1_MG-2023]MDO6588306.1 carbohydrate ABC transporter permease [Salipiger sp. 1_MG-2023]
MNDTNASQLLEVGGASSTLRPISMADRARSLGLWSFLIITLIFFLTPLYVMVITSLKTMPEIREGRIFSLPLELTFRPWVQAWSEICTGLTCEGISRGFWNSMRIMIPATLISVTIGALNGFALAFWRSKGSEALFALLLIGAFIPYQLFIYPLSIGLSKVHLTGTLAGIVFVHVIFGLPITTLIFRNFYSGVPAELVKAARVDGAGFWRIFWSIILPMSGPALVVATILQATGVWNDYLLSLIFAGRDNQPMTAQLNALVNTRMGERPYNIHMAATLLTAMVPLIIYFTSGRWFVRGIAAGAVKG